RRRFHAKVRDARKKWSTVPGRWPAAVTPADHRSFLTHDAPRRTSRGMDIDPARVDRLLSDPKIPKADKDALVAAIRARPRTATITAPDGRTATLTIPAGASDELIREKALEAKARMLSLSQVRQETKDQPGPLRATAGVG